MSFLTPAQWAQVGAESLRLAMAANGMTPTPDDIAEARDAAVYIATGRRYVERPAEPGEEAARAPGQG